MNEKPKIAIKENDGKCSKQCNVESQTKTKTKTTNKFQFKKLYLLQYKKKCFHSRDDFLPLI